MIDRQTVLVLGAGASMDFGFPSGDELAYEIFRTGGRGYAGGRWGDALAGIFAGNGIAFVWVNCQGIGLPGFTRVPGR